MRDFFVAPAEATTLRGFSKAAALGSLSLITNTVAAAGLGVASISSSVGRGVAALAFDDDYARARAAAGGGGGRAGTAAPSNAASGLVQGTADLGRGIAEGLAGVVLAPLRGAREGGAAGFATGLGRGLAGLIVKPVAGVLDFTTRTTEGVVASAKTLTAMASVNANGGGGRESSPGGGGGGGVGGGTAGTHARQRPPRLMWGLQRSLLSVEPIHATVLALIRAAIEAADGDARAAESAARRAAAAARAAVRSAPIGAKTGDIVHALRERERGAGGAVIGAATSGGDASAKPPAALSSTSALLHETESAFLNLVSGRDAALRAHLAAAHADYLHHILWPRSPFLFIVTTRAVIFARVNRAALGSGPMAAASASFGVPAAGNLAGSGGSSSSTSTSSAGNGSGRGIAATGGGASKANVVALCWHVPVLTRAARSLIESSVGSAAAVRGGGIADGVGISALRPAARSRDADTAMREMGRFMGTIASENATRETRALAGHLAFLFTTTAVTRVCESAAAASAATAALRAKSSLSGTPQTQSHVVLGSRASAVLDALEGVGGSVGGAGGGSGVGGGSGGGATPPPTAPPLSLMLYDAFVQRRFDALRAVPPTAQAPFKLPARVVDSMTLFVDPRPLHFGDAIATLGNVRADAHPRDNVRAFGVALALMHAAYSRYATERAAWLRSNPGAPGAGEADALARVTRLDAADVAAVFNFAVSRAAIDRPLLSAVLAQAFLAQRGGVVADDGGDIADGAATGVSVEDADAEEGIAMFLRACEWGAVSG